jgi:hypothetical protein
MKLCLEFEATRSNLMNQDRSPSLDVCFGELLREEQRLYTQAAFQQDANPNPVAYAAYRSGKGKDMCQIQCITARSLVILQPIVQRRFATIARNGVTLS